MISPNLKPTNMEYKIKGSEKNILKLLKVNSLFMKRNNIKAIKEEKGDSSELTLKIEELTSSNQELQDLINEYLAEIEKYKSNVIDLTELNKNLNAGITESNSAIQDLENGISELTNTLNETLALKNAYGDKIERLNKRLNELEKPSTAKSTAQEVADLIEKCETKEQLDAYKDDDRQTARNAYNKKLKSFG